MVIPQGRKINKVMCLFFLAITFAFLAATAVFALLDKEEVSHTLFVLALITGAFSLLFGLLWSIYSRKEKRAEKMLRETVGQQYVPEDPTRIDSWQFILPKERLIETARQRFIRLIQLTGIASIGISLLIWVAMFVSKITKSYLQLVSLFLFCLIVSIPGILVQWFLYRMYKRSVPSRILLYPGKLIVDELKIPAEEIREIKVTPDRIINRSSPSVFREMLVRTDKRSIKYRIDFRTGSAYGEAPFWEEYEYFIAALSEWGAKNSVPVTISYMA